MKCFTASSNRAACRAASNAASRSRLAVVRCQASQNGLPQTLAAVAASSLLMVSPALAELVPVDNFSKNLESEYEKIIAARTGKSSALPELTAPPPAAAPAAAEYVKPAQIKAEKLEVVKTAETKVEVPAAEPAKAVAAPVAAPKPAAAPAAAPKPAVPAAIKAVAPEAPAQPAAAKPVPEALPAKTTTSPAILIGAVGLVALIAVGASSSNKEAAPAAPAAEPTPAAAPSEASSSEQTPTSS